MENVTLKGTKSGIILVLNPDISFETLLDSIKNKFTEAASFLGKNEVGLLIRGRKLSDEEAEQVVNMIHQCSMLRVTSVMSDDSEYEEFFKLKMEQMQHQDEPVAEPGVVTSFDGEESLIYRGNVRQGQDISSEKSIVVLGDVKPGATVTSAGSIFVLGELRGNAYAGANGDGSCIIMALELEPIQLRIAGATAVSADAEKGAKIKKKRRWFFGDKQKDAEVAYVDNDKIVKTTYGSAFLRNYYNI